MCGIIGYVGPRECKDLILDGLERLEYRGYDSAGIALLEHAGESFSAVRAIGNLAKLRDAAGDNHSAATTGLGHTRWATHGKVTEANAHPHFDQTGKVAVVMNGIIENYAELRAELAGRGVAFTSETDTEVIPHFIGQAYRGDIAEAVREVVPRLQGHYAFVAMHADEPGRLVGARKECPLVVGVGDGERFFASAIPAFLRETRDIQIIESGEVVVLEPHSTTVWNGGAPPLDTREVTRVEMDEDAAEKGGHETFMLKEIHEQPAALWDTIGDRLHSDGSVELADLGLDDAVLARVERIHIVGCGTSFHAGLVSRYLIEDWSRVPVHIEVASEYRYRTCLAGPGDLVIGVTQSGETADTLAAMRVARERGAHVVAVTNIMGSQATRDSDGVIFTRAGLEIGVAATKTHTAQIMALALLALKLGRLKWALTSAGAVEIAADLRRLPDLVKGYLESPAPAQVYEVAGRYFERPFFLYLGRHVGVPVCFEGALKLKEISYIPTEAYPAGEMKHGPIALLDEGSPVVVVATDGHVFDKVVSNIQEVKARGARVVAVATEGNPVIEEHADDILWCPKTPPLLSPITANIPLQLFAYAVARAKGLNVDQPRNLAKTVTVE